MSESSGSSDRRERIMSAAERAFDANGYAATTMAAVASQADVAKGSIYNYFRSKEDLFTQVCLQMLALGQTDVEQSVAQPVPASDKIRQVVDSWYTRLGQYRLYGRLMLEFWATAARQKLPGELAKAVERTTSQAERQIQAIIEQGTASGEFRKDANAAVAASLIVGVLRGMTVQAIVLGSNIDEEFVAEMQRDLLASLTAGAGRADTD